MSAEQGTLADEAIERRFQPYLMAGERTFWTGQPDPSLIFSRADLFLVPFSLLWGGFAIVWEGLALYAVTRGGQEYPQILLFPIFGLFFVFIGLYLIAGRFLVKRIAKQRTYYAVTDRRVLALDALLSPTLRSIDIEDIPLTDLTVRANGVGSLSFGRQYPGLSWLAGVTWLGTSGVSPQDSTLTYVDIPNVQKVYTLINELREKHESKCTL